MKEDKLKKVLIDIIERVTMFKKAKDVMLGNLEEAFKTEPVKVTKGRKNKK